MDNTDDLAYTVFPNAVVSRTRIPLGQAKRFVRLSRQYRRMLTGIDKVQRYVTVYGIIDGQRGSISNWQQGDTYTHGGNAHYLVPTIIR